MKLVNTPMYIADNSFFYFWLGNRGVSSRFEEQVNVRKRTKKTINNTWVFQFWLHFNQTTLIFGFLRLGSVFISIIHCYCKGWWYFFWILDPVSKKPIRIEVRNFSLESSQQVGYLKFLIQIVSQQQVGLNVNQYPSSFEEHTVWTKF